MTNLALAITYEIMFQRLAQRPGLPITRAWCMGCVPFLIQASNHLNRRA